MRAQYERYAALRDREGMSDADVVRETGIAQSTFSDWKAGRSAPKIDKLMRISALFGETIESLLSEDPDPSPAETA